MCLSSMFILVLGLEAAILGTAAGAEAEKLRRGQLREVKTSTDGELESNFCNDLSKEKFLCHVVFAEFCTYCRKDSGNECVTKHEVAKYEKGAYRCTRAYDRSSEYIQIFVLLCSVCMPRCFKSVLLWCSCNFAATQQLTRPRFALIRSRDKLSARQRMCHCGTCCQF
jgi:hypothetical protein